MQGNRNLSPQSDFSIQHDVIVRPRQFHNGVVCQRSYGYCLRYGTVKKEQKDAVMSFCNDVFIALPTGYGKLFNGIKQELHHSYSQISKFSFVFLFHSINAMIVYIYTTLLHVNHVGGVASLAS